MKAKRRLLFQILAVVLLVAIGYTMTIIGRGHTIYLHPPAFQEGQRFPGVNHVYHKDAELLFS